MHEIEEQERMHRQSWLDSTYGPKLLEIQTAVINKHQQEAAEAPPMPYFTPHGIEHCKAVENLLHLIIPGRQHELLSQKEKYYLLASAWLHDIGALRIVANSINRTEPVLEVNEIRKRHHLSSEKYIVEHWKELRIDEADKETLGKLCRYHRGSEDLNECEETSVLSDGESIHLRLLAAYLRLADSLDISSSRTPAEPYAICLAYDIPDDSKLHWIKSRLVNGIYLNCKNHTILVQFKYPYPEELKTVIDSQVQYDKLNSIKKLVIDNLRAELSEVVHVIARAEIAVYLDVKEEIINVSFTRQMLNDLREIVLNYDIMMQPSASRLLEMILTAIANITGFSLDKDKDPLLFPDAGMQDFATIKQKIENFINSIEDRIINSRPCHLGLVNLITSCKKLYKESMKQYDSLPVFAKQINDLYKKHIEARRNVRIKSKEFFSKELTHFDSAGKINILLYGYSELVTKAVCGLRDFLINQEYKLDPYYIYGSKLERGFSDKINIFICEGQPKTQTSRGDRLIYHDGSQYALYLKIRGFTNIMIIPDFITETIFEKTEIDYVFISANGITEQHFLHAAGHSAIVQLARKHNEDIVNTNRKKVNILLVTTKEKAQIDCNEKLSPNSADRAPKIQSKEIEGCRFAILPQYAINRHHIWMCRDKQLLELLRKEEISFINPREDRIPIDRIDYLISDIGFTEITPKNAGTIIKKHFNL